MSVRILQPGRACFGAQEEMCISSNWIEPPRGVKQGLPRCDSWGAGMRAGHPGRFEGRVASRCLLDCRLPWHPDAILRRG